GKSAYNKKALKIGLIDELVPAPLLEERAMAFAQNVIAKGAKKRRKKYQPKGAMNVMLETVLRGVVLKKAKEMTLKASGGHYPAPLKALEVIKATYGMSDRERALSIEAKGFGEVAATDVSKHLINLFYLMEGVKKQTGVADPSVKPQNISKVAVLGAGTMGG